MTLYAVIPSEVEGPRDNISRGKWGPSTSLRSARDDRAPLF